MIYVFKTSVKSQKDIAQLRGFLNELSHLKKWNFDLNDCDKILRIDSPADIIETVIHGLNDRGYVCSELQ